MAGGSNGPPGGGGSYTYPRKTLAQLRTAIIARLGFMGPMTSPPLRTRAQLRAQVRLALGWPDSASPTETRTLEQIAAIVYDRLGFAGVNEYGPGMQDLLYGFVNEAQATLWRRLELDRGGATPTAMTVAATPSTLDYVPILNLAIAQAKSHYQQGDSKTYFELVEQYLRDAALRAPPNADDIINNILEQAQEAVYRDFGFGVNAAYGLTPFSDDAHFTTIDYHPVLAQAILMAKAHWDRKDTRLYAEELARYRADVEKRMPKNAVGVVTQCLIEAQESLYMRYDQMRAERWVLFTTTAGERFYHLQANGVRLQDAYKLRGAWMQDGGSWWPLRNGINPAQFSLTHSSVPTHFEIREYLELWPAPDKAYQVWLKGHFGLDAFAADGDYTTLEPHLVYLQALARAKEQYRQADAATIFRDAEIYLGKIVAGSHGTRRYIPGDNHGDECGMYLATDYGIGVRRTEDGSVRKIET